jgi:hypothetical protein
LGGHVVNAIERIMRDGTLFRQALVSGQSALGDYDLIGREVADISVAATDAGRLRRLWRCSALL